MARNFVTLALAGLFIPALANAADTSASPLTTTIVVSGSVDKLCSLGAVTSSTLNVGSLTNPTDGTLGSISSKNTSVTGSWCNAPSTIAVVATPMIAKNFAGAPPSGFTKAVNYTASVSGWTSTAATFVTNGDESGTQSVNTPGSQDQTNPQTTVITVGVGTFKSPNTADLLVADSNYSGDITITLAPK